MFWGVGVQYLMLDALFHYFSMMKWIYFKIRPKVEQWTKQKYCKVQSEIASITALLIFCTVSGRTGWSELPPTYRCEKEARFRVYNRVMLFVPNYEQSVKQWKTTRNLPCSRRGVSCREVNGSHVTGRTGWDYRNCGSLEPCHVY